MDEYIRREEFEEPIVQALGDMGGEGHITDVLARVEQIMRPRMTAADFVPGPGTWKDRPRWELEARWARDRLGNAGVVAPSSESGRGTWRLVRPGAKVPPRTRTRRLPPPPPQAPQAPRAAGEARCTGNADGILAFESDALQARWEGYALPAGTAPDERGVVYLLYDGAGRCLYVGEGDNGTDALTAHQVADWYRERCDTDSTQFISISGPPPLRRATQDVLIDVLRPQFNDRARYRLWVVRHVERDRDDPLGAPVLARYLQIIWMDLRMPPLPPALKQALLHQMDAAIYEDEARTMIEHINGLPVEQE